MAGELAEEFLEGTNLFNEAESGISEEGAAGEGAGEGEGEGAGEGGEGGEPEEPFEEFTEDEIKEAKEATKKLRRVINYFKSIDYPKALKTFGKFIVKNTAAAAVFFGVTIGLQKAYAALTAKHGSGSGTSGAGSRLDDVKKKKDIAKGLSQILPEISHLSQSIMDWFKQHENDSAELEGISVPLPDLFLKYTHQFEESNEEIFKIAQALTVKQPDGKTKFLLPTDDQLEKVTRGVAAFCDAMDQFLQHAKELENRFPVLKSLPVKPEDVSKLKDDLKKIE